MNGFKSFPIPIFINFAGLIDSYLERRSPLLLANHDRSFLDIGCAAGYFLDVMRAREWHSQGLELATELVQWGRKYLDLNLHQCSIEDAGLDDDSFTAVAIIETIEHLAYPAEVIQHAFRVLCPGGALLVTCPNFFESIAFEEESWNWDVLDPTGHIQCFTKKSLQDVVSKAGLIDIELTEYGDRTEQLVLLASKPQ